ncbi:MAG: S9 family peptidase [Bacteriovoracaceae bacterium]|nr:S9 family peptidase [Bacteriovoracaceae bacterium]
MTPKAKKVPFKTHHHGHERVDHYHWLRDENWQQFIQGNLDFKDPDVETYIKEENTYTDITMRETEALQKELYDILVSRIKEDDERPPMKHGEYYYYSRIEKGQNYRFRCRKKGSLDAPEEIYLDENKEAEGKGYYSIGTSLRSKGDRFLLLSENNTGSMVYSVRVKDLEENKYLPWTIENNTGSVCWCADFEHIYYVERHPVNGRGQKLFRMNIHAGPASKELVFEKPDELSNLFFDLYSSANKDYIFLNLLDTNSNEVYYLDGKDPKATPKLFWKLKEHTIINPDFCEGSFYIVSNENGLINNQLFTCSENHIERENWNELIEHSETHFLEWFDLYRGYLVYKMTNNELALPELYVYDLLKGETREISMKDAAYSIGYLGALEFESPTVQFTYQSPIAPEEVKELDLASGRTIVIKQGHCPNFDTDHYEVERVFVPAHDGEEIPLTIVTKKGFKRDGKAPHFQYAYGSYGMSMPAYFSSTIFALVDKGFSFSIAHIRGGADKGYQWYLDGKMLNKINTFKDFISCSQWLIDSGFTAKGKITANGGSAGGLLMGAISNMTSELYNSVILDVPFVDVVTTILDDTLPLTPPEWNEWGNPIKDKEAYEYMLSYSPYDQVQAKDYPHMLFNTGITDEQVTYWEPTKMVAKLRELKTDQNMLLLKLKMTAGHAGSSARYKALKEKAFSYAFALKAQES